MSTEEDYAVTSQMGNENSTIDEEGAPAPPPKELADWNPAAVNALEKMTSIIKPGSPAPGPPRLKKKVPWKGKNIMVLLPRDVERGNTGNAPTPMTREDVQAKMTEWEDQGYNTSGFTVEEDDNFGPEGGSGQSRGIWPEAADVEQERQQRSFKVSIPNRREWDAYVQELLDAKLRALGVSVGDEDPPIPAPAPAISRRQSVITTYPQLPFSPPIPTGSAGSSHNPFSPPLMGGNGLSTSQSSHPGSIASPASMHAHLQGKYNPRQSVSFGASENGFGSPFQYPQQQSPGVWSPYQQGGHRAGSPSVSNLSALASPSSPFMQDGYFQQGDMMSQMNARGQLLQNQLHHQQQLQLSARASPRLPEVSEVDEDIASKSPSKTPEARQLKHNPSASLQKEIDDAEYHLEEQFQRQLEHDDYSPHSEKVDDEAHFPTEPTQTQNGLGLGNPQYSNNITDSSDDRPVLHHPQPHSRGHSLSQRPFQESEDSSSAAETNSRLMQSMEALKELSDLETNPSLLGTPVPDSLNGHDRAISLSSNPWNDSETNHTDSSAPRPRRPGHVSKPSIFNAAAKEFKFEPSNSFKSSNFSFSGANFQAPISTFSTFNPPTSSTSSHFSHHSIGSGKINVEAPAFTPGHSDFNFSATGPSFRPDAPTFMPSYGSVGSGASGSEGPIFGGIDLSALGIIKNDKKNKAIPIIRPDSTASKQDENEDVEDKDGRITQGAGRIKRARGDQDDGDSVPLFASMPLSETTREQSPPKENTALPAAPVDKENSAPVSEAASLPNDDFAPSEFPQQNQAEDLSGARPFTSRRYNSGLPGYGFYAPSEDEKVSPMSEEVAEDEKRLPEPEPIKKSHKKNSLSGAAKPFEFRPGAFNFTFGGPSEPEPAPVAPIAENVPKKAGLKASRWASPSPPPDIHSAQDELEPEELPMFQAALPGPQSPPEYGEDDRAESPDREPTFEEIDAVMRQLNEVENEAPTPRKDYNRDEEIPRWNQASPVRNLQAPDMEFNNSSPFRLQPSHLMRSDAPSPSPGRFQALPGQQRIFSRVHHEDPFVAESPAVRHVDSPLAMRDTTPPSDWDDVVSDGEAGKLQPRARFFDGRVNDIVGGLLDQRLDPLEKALNAIHVSIEMMSARGPSTRRDRRSFSGALSDADDEDDDEDAPRRSLSPRRDKKMDKIRAIISEALATHQSRPQTATSASGIALPDSRNVLAKIEEMKEQFGQSMRLDLRGEDLRNIVEEAVQARMPEPKPDDSILLKDDLRTIIEEVVQNRLPVSTSLDESALSQSAETQSRVNELEERLRRAEAATEQEIQNRRAVEDRLAENQRLLRISTEEEMRLRESMDERETKIREIVDISDAKVRAAEDARAHTAMQNAILEASQENTHKDLKDLATRFSMTEDSLRDSQQDAQRWQMDAERALEAARRHSEDAEQANETNKDLKRTIDTLKTQMEESIRVREGMRGMLTGLQEDMALAAQNIAQENAQRAKKEAELVARQEVLDAKLQAEARTRERLESDIERLEISEREGARAVSECQRLEQLVTELRQDAHLAKQDAMRYQREFEDARESGLGEVQRTRNYMQVEIESANNQVNVVRDDLEMQLSRVRNELDQVTLDYDTTREKHEMLLESLEQSKKSMADELRRKHANEMEELQTMYDRKLNNTSEDAQRSEQHLLERLSLSSSKTEHLQDRVSHLEEKLEIAKSAANAAVAAAKGARSNNAPGSEPIPYQAPVQQKAVASKATELPERISPQALRESIMVLQEQLQDREQTIEKLEATVASLDPESGIKIQKRDDEISWLRELLDVRKSDLKDVVTALHSNNYDPEQVKDAAIRLSANLQMEEQERERAMNGGSAITLPNIAVSLRDAASPRVAQAVGPLAAAWGNWRKGRTDPNISEVMGGSTPSRGGNNSPSSNSFLSGLLTPPTSSLRTPPISGGQPTAFGSTGQRFTNAQLANRPRNMTPRAREKQPLRGSPRKAMGGPGPSTPPMMRQNSYDNDARAEDFSDAGFYDDDESALDESIYGGKLR